MYENSEPNPLLQTLSAEPQETISLARHVILPFDLRISHAAAFSEKENGILLASIFPGCTGTATDGYFMYYFLKELPPKPWPKTIAGLPPHFSESPEQLNGPMPRARLVGWRGGSIAEDRNYRDVEDWDPLFDLINDHFQSLAISMTEVIYWGNQVTIVLEYRDTDLSKLPWKVAKVHCVYLYDDEMGRPSTPQARRLRDPVPGSPDESRYDDTLQPGVMVTSGYFPDQPTTFLSTTAGVMVEDEFGEQFVTVANRGFPTECGTDVMHPLPTDGRTIGNLVKEVPQTDIALVKLLGGERFLNVTFQNEINAEPIQLKSLAQSCRTGDLILLDSPYTGCIEGSVLASARQRIPADNDSLPEQLWVRTVWSYMGQDEGSALPDELCGSAIHNEEGQVVAFFRYAPQVGSMVNWCAGISARELIDQGFTLVDQTSRAS